MYIRSIYLILNILFSSYCVASPNDHNKIETNFKIINFTNSIVPVKIKTYQDTQMLNAPESLSPGENVFTSSASPSVDLRFTLDIGNEKNKPGQCHVVSYTLFGEGLKEGDGSDGFQCFMASSTKERKPYLKIQSK